MYICSFLMFNPSKWFEIIFDKRNALCIFSNVIIKIQEHVLLVIDNTLLIIDSKLHFSQRISRPLQIKSFIQ